MTDIALDEKALAETQVEFDNVPPGLVEAIIAAWNRRVVASEQWAAIPGWEGAYEASDAGRIRSVDRSIRHSDGGIRQHKGRTLKPRRNNKGYLSVGLYDAANGKKGFKTVHRLVARTFIPNPDDLPEVNHLDGDKQNCAVSNLEWCSSSTNSVHSTQYRLNPVAKLTDQQVREITARHKSGESKRSLARLYHVDPKSIRRIVDGEAYAWVDRASPSQVAPANPAQVTDARYDSVALEAAREIMTLTRSGVFDDRLKAKIQVRITEAITAAIGAGGQAVGDSSPPEYEHELTPDELAQIDAAKETQKGARPKEMEWIERWYGSEPMKGWSIVQGRETVAYLGPDVDGEKVTAIVTAHNVSLSGQATAWRVRGAEYDRVFTDEADAQSVAEGFGGIVVPLYAKPAQTAKLPRLTDAMIRAACKAHFGSDNADGVCVTVKDRDWTFRDAFKRMWRGAASAASEALSHPHPADERVVEALRIAHSFIAREYRDEKSLALEGEFVSKEARPVFSALSEALAALSATEGQKHG